MRPVGAGVRHGRWRGHEATSPLHDRRCAVKGLKLDAESAFVESLRKVAFRIALEEWRTANQSGLAKMASASPRKCEGGGISNGSLWTGTNLVVSSLPIRLTQTPTTCWVRPIAGVEFSVGRRLSPARDPQQLWRVEQPRRHARTAREPGRRAARLSPRHRMSAAQPAGLSRNRVHSNPRRPSGSRPCDAGSA